MKRTFLFVALMAFSWAVSHAQITTAWTTTIPAADLPDDANRPTVAALSTSTPLRANFTLYLDATTYDNANDSTAFAALGTAVKAEIDSNYVEAVWGLDPSLDIVGRIVITRVIRTFDAFDPNDLSEQYVVDEDVFRVDGYMEWEIESP